MKVPESTSIWRWGLELQGTWQRVDTQLLLILTWSLYVDTQVQGTNNMIILTSWSSGLFGPLSLSKTHRYPKVPTVPYAGVAPAPAGHQPAAYSTASSSLHTYYLRHVLVLTHGSRSNRSPMMTDEYMPRGRGEFPAAESSGRPSLWPRTNS
jgi:hypothetical protein